MLPVRKFDQRIGLTQAFANTLDDARDPGLTEQTFLGMVRSRVYGILAGYTAEPRGGWLLRGATQAPGDCAALPANHAPGCGMEKPRESVTLREGRCALSN